MNIIRRRGWEVPESQVTPERYFLSRRALIAGGVGALNNFALGVSTSYEIDFWGRLRRLQEAAQAQYAASDFGREVVALTLAAAISRTYFNVRALDTQIVVSQQTLKVVED